MTDSRAIFVIFSCKRYGGECNELSRERSTAHRRNNKVTGPVSAAKGAVQPIEAEMRPKDALWTSGSRGDETVRRTMNFLF